MFKNPPYIKKAKFIYLRALKSVFLLLSLIENSISF